MATQNLSQGTPAVRSPSTIRTAKTNRHSGRAGMAVRQLENAYSNETYWGNIRILSTTVQVEEWEIY